MSRSDNRSGLEIRQLQCTKSILTTQEGSAKFSFASTTVLASVRGPIEGKDERIDSCAISISFTPSNNKTPRHSFYERLLHDVATHIINTTEYPRCVVEISLNVVCDDGSLLSCCINAMQLALLDACISCCCTVSSCSVLFDADSQVMLDPSKQEEEGAQSVHVFVFDTMRRLVACDSIGWITPGDYVACAGVGAQACEKIHEFLRLAVGQGLEY